MNNSERIDKLIAAVDFFKDPKNKGGLFGEIYDEDEIRTLAFLALTDFPNITPSYIFYDEEEIKKITLDQFEKELQRIKTALVETAGNIPPDLNSLIEKMDEGLTKRESTTLDHSVSDLYKKHLTVIKEVDKVTSSTALVLALQDEKVRENLKKQATVDTSGVIANVENRIKNVVYEPKIDKHTIAVQFVTGIANSNPNGKTFPLLNVDTGEIIDMPIGTTSFPAQEIDSRILTSLNRQVEKIKEDASQIVPVLSIEPEYKNEIGGILTATVGEEVAIKVVPQAKGIESLSDADSILVGATSGIGGGWYIGTVTRLATPVIAKEDPEKASAATLTFVWGMTAGQVEKVLGEANINTSTSTKVIDNMRNFQTLGGSTFVTLAAKGAGMNPKDVARVLGQIKGKPNISKFGKELVSSAGYTSAQVGLFTKYLQEGLPSTFSGAGLSSALASGNTYQNLQNVLPPVTGVRGFFLRAGQQVLGGRAAGIFNRFVANGAVKIAQKLGGVAIKKVIEGAVSAAASAIPVIGTIIAPILARLSSYLVSKIGPWLKKWGLPFLGGAVGFMFGGPLLAAGGFAAGLFGTGYLAAGSVAAGIAAITGFLGILISAFAAVIVAPLVVTIIGIPIVVVLILFIINSGAYVVPPGPALSISNPFTPVEGTGKGSHNLSCGGMGTATSATNVVAGPKIAMRASQIAGTLKRGFWGDYNYPLDVSPSPSYPELWNQLRFDQNPNPPYPDSSPGGIQTCGDCLFWCTWLVQKSYRESGDTSLELALGVEEMCHDFANRGLFVSANNATPTNIMPGSVVFISVSGGFDHVAVVTTVNQDSIEFAQSNAGTRGGSITFNSNGAGVQDIGGWVIIGFGLP